MRLMVPDLVSSGTSQVVTWWPPYPDWQVGESVALLLMQGGSYQIDFYTSTQQLKHCITRLTVRFRRRVYLMELK